MYTDMCGNLVLEMPDIDVKCPSCKHNFSVDGDQFDKEFLEPMASAAVECEKCNNQFYVHIKN
jgi:predicted Zn finger-like uncharacterized protein